MVSRIDGEQTNGQEVTTRRPREKDAPKGNLWGPAKDGGEEHDDS